MADTMLGHIASDGSKGIPMRPLLLTLLLTAALPASAATKTPPPGPQAPAHAMAEPADGIVAVVNGEVITRADVDNRARLFALTTGQPIAPEALRLLRPQITRELIDDRLRMQEIQRRKIAVPDIDVAHAIADIEQRNHLPAGGLQSKLSGQGVSPSTLIAQIRTQLGWTRVLRQELSERGRIGPNEIAEQEKIFRNEQGKPQYRLGEIFVAAEDPSHLNDAKKFADTVIQQLHAGAPFGIVAAEFSQSQTALEGGSLGWVRPDQLDPTVANLVAQMPVGAVSNPVRVAGGFDVVTLQEKRLVGSDLATVLSLRQAFYPFSSQLDPANPTPEQRKALTDGQNLAKTAHTCADIEAANSAAGGKRAADPGPVRLDRLSGPMQQLLGGLPENQASKALVTNDGILVVMVCKREQKNMAAMSHDDIANQLLEERVELASRQLQQDLKRRALIDQRN